MEAFLDNLQVILPVIGLDLLKPRVPSRKSEIMFEIRHKSGVKAHATEVDGEFIVLAGSQALKEPGYARNSYAELKADLIRRGVLVPATDGKTYEFTKSYGFKSPSAAGSVLRSACRAIVLRSA